MNVNRRGRSLNIHAPETLDDRVMPSSGIPAHPTAAVASVPVHHPAVVAPLTVRHPVTAVTPTHAARPVAAVAPKYAFRPIAAVVSTTPNHPVNAVTPTGAVPSAGTSGSGYSPNGTPMDKIGQTLNIIYQEYLAYVEHGPQGPFVSSQSDKVVIRLPAGTTDGGSTEVGVSVQVSPGHLDQALSDMTKFGMEVGPTDRAHGIITGYLPISQLASAANDAQLTNITPMFKPPTQVPPRFGPR